MFRNTALVAVVLAMGLSAQVQGLPLNERDIVAPYVTIDPNGEVQAIGATVTWKRDMPAATPPPMARDDIITAPYVTVNPDGEVEAPGVDVTWKRDDIIDAPYVTVDPNGEVEAIGATVTWKRDMPAATPPPVARDENARRDYIGPYVTIANGEVYAPYVAVNANGTGATVSAPGATVAAT